MYHHYQCSAQGQVLHCKRRNPDCSSAEGRSPTANSLTKVAVLPGTEQVRQLPLAFRTPHSLASEQTLKDLKDPRVTNVEVRRVDLANLALRTSSKFNKQFLTRTKIRKSQSPFAPIMYQLQDFVIWEAFEFGAKKPQTWFIPPQ